MKLFFSAPYIFITTCILTSCSVNKIASKNALKSSNKGIIEDAIALNLDKAQKDSSISVIKYKKQALKKVAQAEYEQALKIILLGLKKFPQSFSLQSSFAALLGDISELYTDDRKSRTLEKSKKTFEKLLNEVEGQGRREIYRFKNEYYFRFAMYKEQYNSGLQMVDYYHDTKEWISEGGFLGYYYQGVGAVYYAKQLLINGNNKNALHEAQKSLTAWAQYFSYKNDYYNSYVHYALALGILGYKIEMVRALKHAADLINRDLDYHEFKEVIDFVQSLK